MALIRHRPAAPLAHYVDCFWLSRRDAAQDFSEHMLPSGSAQLLFALHDDTLTWRAPDKNPWTAWTGSIVHGPQARFYEAGPKPKGCVVGVSFRPGGAAALLGVGMRELADRHVALEAIWGAHGVEVRHQLMAATESTAIFQVLERTLRERLHRSLPIHPAIAHVLAARDVGAFGPIRIADLQRESGYSPRHFTALFHAAVGLKPKHYYRIQRFNAAARRLAVDEGRNLSDVAAAAQYCDQAHLAREFRELAGVVPSHYRASGKDRPLHHRVGEAPLPARHKASR